jgi:hypothetical protein
MKWLDFEVCIKNEEKRTKKQTIVIRYQGQQTSRDIGDRHSGATKTTRQVWLALTEEPRSRKAITKEQNGGQNESF